MKTCACIDALYVELPFADRIRAAKRDGFNAIEFWDWRDKNLEEIRRVCNEIDMPVSGFNGDAELSMIDPGQREDYIAYIRQSVETAKFLNAASVTIHSNGLGEGGLVINSYNALSDTVKICTMFRTLMECAKIGEDNAVTMNLEGLNITTDHVGNFLQKTRTAAEMIRLIGSPRLKVLYDVYHMQLNEGSICDTIRQYGDTFGHVHVADAPGRHEPGTGEICFPAVYAALEGIGYRGYVGYELFAKTTTEEAVRAIMTVR